MKRPPDDLNGPIYQDAQRYDAEHWWKTDDMQFWEKMAARFGPNVLELAAGTGRLAPMMLGSADAYTGVDASSSFLERARKKLEPWGEKVTLHHGDIRHLELGQTFDLIAIGFNSFLHLLTDDDAGTALKAIRQHCHADTRFIIDIFIPDPLFLNRPENMRIEAMTYVDPDTDETVKVSETNLYDPENGINKITWFYSTETKPDFLRYNFLMRMYYPDTMDRLLTEAGFRIAAKWGDYDETPLDPESALQIYVAMLT